MLSGTRCILVALASVAFVGAGGAKPPSQSASTFRIALSGQAEVNVVHLSGGTGDLDGAGFVKLSIDPERKRVCYDFRISGLDTPLMAHIHRGRPFHNGPTVVTLFTGPGAKLRDCLLWNYDRLAEIVARPADFYVNLDTTEYPDGALRGQLAVPTPVQVASTAAQ